MIELCTMHTSPHIPIILPLFFRIKPHDLKSSSPYFSTWKEAWKNFAEKDPSRVDIRKWESAAIELSRIQGEVYQTQMGEDRYIEAILLRICSIICPPLRYSVSHLTGHKRLTGVVSQLFEAVPATTSHLKARALGFFAIGGQGKTTISKLMVNHYASFYGGRCALIEFPSNDCNEKEMSRQCNKALQRLTNSNTHNMDDFDQCLQWMRERVMGMNVFIAIDNVWEVCLEFAQRILDVGFSVGSKILVTSRSRQVLLSLLQDTNFVMPLPGVNEEEAHQIFVKSFNRNQAGLCVSSLEDADVHDVTESLLFHGKYHPLTINVVGVNLGRTGGHDWHTAWKLKRRDFIGSGSVTDKAIKINYDSIPKSRRDLFLDVALVCIPMKEEVSGIRNWLDDNLEANHNLSFDVVPILLGAIYKGEMEKHEIGMTLKQLAYDGLLEFEDSEVHVHDLYKDLAAREAALSSRFMSLDNEVLPDINLAEAERIVCWSNCISVSKLICGLDLPKLRVFIGNGWNPVHMPQIRVLKLCIDGKSECKMDWRSMPELSRLELEFEEEAQFSKLRIANDISWLRHLCVLVLRGSRLKDADSDFEDTDEKFADADGGADEDFEDAYENFEKNQDFEDADSDFEEDEDAEKDLEDADGDFEDFENADGDYEVFEDAIAGNEVLCLDGLVNLQFLCINGVDCLQEISGLGSLIHLKGLVLRGLPGLLKVGNFNSSCSQLQLLHIESCNKLREVAGLDLTSNLKTLTLVNNCDLPPQLQRLPASESLQHLDLGYLSSLPDFRGVPALKSLLLRFTAMANVRVGFRGMPALESLFLSFVDEAIVMTVGFHGLPNLKHLDIMGGVLEEINFPCYGLPRLETLNIYGVQRLTKLNFYRLKDLVNLRRFFIESCHELEEIDWSTLNDLSNLTYLRISDCKQLNHIRGEPNRINHTLCFLEIWGCPRLNKFRGLHLLTNCKFDFR